LKLQLGQFATGHAKFKPMQASIANL